MDILVFFKILGCTVIGVVLIAAAVWFAILVVDGLDGINKKLIIIVNILRTSYQVNGKTLPEVKNNEKDNEGSDSGSRDDGGNSIAY